MKQKIALITGITGQDGAYLAELLLEKNYCVYGICRSKISEKLWRLSILGIIEHKDLHIIECNITHVEMAINLLKQIKPVEIYNLAAMSSVVLSHENPSNAVETNAMLPFYLLEAIRLTDSSIRFFQASTAEMYGNVTLFPQNEETPLCPNTIYGTYKLFAHYVTLNYRENYHIFACSGILFNHESPLRGKEFVTYKIVNTLKNIKQGKTFVLELGNLEAKRDWGYAKEYVQGIYLMMQDNQPSTYVLASGCSHSVREFVECTAKLLGFEIHWEGQGLKEIGRDLLTGKVIISINPKYYRTSDSKNLVGSSDKIRKKLHWAAHVGFSELCHLLVEDLKQ